MAGLEKVSGTSEHSDDNKDVDVKDADITSPGSSRPQPIHARGDHTYGAVDMTTVDNLPPGWTRKVVQRMGGKSAGRFDVYIYSPDGKKFRSKLELATHFAMMKLNLDIEDFEFSGRGKGSPSKKQTPAKKTSKSAKKASAKKTKKSPAEDKSGKTMSQKLVVKMKFSTPPKGKKARQSPIKKSKRGNMKRSNSESAAVLTKGKAAGVKKTPVAAVQRSVSVELGKTSPRSPTRKSPQKKILCSESSTEKSVPRASDGSSPILETNNNDVNWSASPRQEQKLGKRKNSHSNTGISPSGTSPYKVSRTSSEDNTSSPSKSRRLSLHGPSRSVKGEEIVMSKPKQRKLSGNY